MADLMGSAGYTAALSAKTRSLAMGSHGRAFLFSHAMNIKEGAQEDRQLLSGLHRVSDVYCSDCGEELGWTYTKAFDETQKYKEGKFVLENFKIIVQSHFHPTDQL